MTSLLSDEMLRQLIAVGQADVMVGIPTLNHAGAIRGIVDAVTRCFRGSFPQARAVLVNVDGGSDDGTPELVLEPDSAIDRMYRAVLCYNTRRVAQGLADVDWLLERQPEEIPEFRLHQLREMIEALQAPQ